MRFKLISTRTGKAIFTLIFLLTLAQPFSTALCQVRVTNPITTIEGGGANVYSVSFSPDGTMLASGSEDGTIKLWDVASRQNIVTLRGHTRRVRFVSYSPDGKVLASGSYDRTIKLWDVASRQNIATLRGHTDYVYSVSFSPDGTMLASGAADETIKLWDIATERIRILATLEGHTAGVRAISYSPDGRTLASGSWDGTNGIIKLWDVGTRRNIATLEGPRAAGVKSVSYSPDGTMLASGAVFGTIKLWDAVLRVNITTLQHTDAIIDLAELAIPFFPGVNSVSYSPDGRTLASGAADGTIKLWDVAIGENIATFRHMDIDPLMIPLIFGVNSVSYSPDGRTLASGAADGTIKLWDVSEWSTVVEKTPTPDFDGNDQVDFADFLEFVARFGASRGDSNYDAKYDLDGDGTIGFGDFLIFTASFGTSG